jgi:hypothetical protein
VLEYTKRGIAAGVAEIENWSRGWWRQRQTCLGAVTGPHEKFVKWEFDRGVDIVEGAGGRDGMADAFVNLTTKKVLQRPSS